MDLVPQFTDMAKTLNQHMNEFDPEEANNDKMTDIVR